MNTAIHSSIEQTEISPRISFTLPYYKLSFGGLVLALLVLLSGLAVIYLADVNRRLAISAEEALSTQNQLHLDWTKLLLEQSTWATQARIQNIASGQLGMQTPVDNQTVMIKEG